MSALQIETRGVEQSELEALAASLGAALRAGDVVLLQGPMGAGKTTWTRALARGLRVDRPERVRSPTFNICLVHPGPIALCHVDLFRLDPGGAQSASGPSPAFEALGLQAWIDEHTEGAPGQDDAVIVVEWADLWAAPLADALRIRLEVTPQDPARRDVYARAEGPRAGQTLQRWAEATSLRVEAGPSDLP